MLARVIPVGALAILVGCAAELGTRPAPKASAPPAATVAEAAAQPAPEAPSSFKPPSGYKATKLGAETLYCKKEKILGSIFPTEICLSEDELKEVERRSEGMRLNKQKASGVCGGAGSCGNGG